MQWVDFGDGKPVRAFVCTSPNPWGYPAKDRSGRLEQLEPPNLGKLIAKLIPVVSSRHNSCLTRGGDHALRLFQLCPTAARSRAHPRRHVASVQARIRPGGAGEGISTLQGRQLRDAGLRVRARRRALRAAEGLDQPRARRHDGGARPGRGDLAVSCAPSSNLARGIKPDDLSDQARARRTADLKDFDNIIFVARIGVEKGKPRNDGSGESYPDKNVIAVIITPDKKDWHPVDQPPPFNGGSGAGATVAPSLPSPDPAAPPTPGVKKPVWA